MLSHGRNGRSSFPTTGRLAWNLGIRLVGVSEATAHKPLLCLALLATLAALSYGFAASIRVSTPGRACAFLGPAGPQPVDRAAGAARFDLDLVRQARRPHHGGGAGDGRPGVRSQITGRIDTVANSKIIDEPIYNDTGVFPFIWEEMSLPSPTATTARLAAARILPEAARRHTVSPHQRGRRSNWRAATASRPTTSSRASTGA